MNWGKLFNSKRNKRIFYALASIVVFVTTYMLVLPALTIDEETAIQDPAISNETLTQEQVNELETVADPFTIEQEREDALANTEEKTEITDETSEESLNVLENEEAKEQEIEIKNTAEVSGDLLYFKDESTSVKVYVEAPLEAFPEGTYMVVTPIESHEVLDSVNSALDNTKAKKVEAVDITFYDKDGNEIEPSTQIKVSLVSDLIKDSKDAQIVHIDNEGTGTVVTPSDEESADDEIIFESKDFSTYVVVVETEITIKNDEGNNETYVVSVTYGPEANIPDGSTLSVSEIEEGTEEYERAKNAVLADKQAKGEEVFLPEFGFVALDISILNPSGEEIEPAAPVQVDIRIKSLPNVADLSEVEDTIEIQHHVEVEDGVVVDTVYSGGSADAKFDVATNEEVIAEGTAIDPNDYEPNTHAGLESLDEIVTSFETGTFSTYTISWGNRSYRIHYVDTQGNSLTPTRTPEFSNGFKFLIYDVEGYEFDSAHYGSRTGTAIKPLLANYGNDRVYLDNNNNWQYLRDDIYVVYKKKTSPTTGGTPVIDSATEEDWPQDSAKPQFGKSSTNNGNGTNTISLSISGGETPYEKSTPADVIVVFDVSGSMGGNNIWRLNTAKSAVKTMANTLLNAQSSDVRMALISYSTTAQQVNITGATGGFTSNYTNYAAAVDGLQASGGTNWEDGLQLANTLNVRNNAATFVIFVTDGDPTFRISRGNVSDSDLDLYSDGTYQYYRNNYVFGEGNDDSDDRNFDFAVDQVSAIAGAKKNFYAIGISNDVTKVQNLTTQGGVAADHAFIASDSAAMERAFKSITESIKSTLGFGDVEITDGITALTNAEMKVMQSVDPASFKYYRYGGENNKYGADYAHKQEWTSRAQDGCAAATYSKTDGAVHWDMGESFQLEDGVTYVVEFTVWPSQDAYDLVADLNNGLKTYDSLTPEEKAQVVELTAPTESTTGTYALKTNTDEVSATYNRTTKTGDTVTISDQNDVVAEYHEGTLQNMTLDSDYITVRKEWHNALDERVVNGITLSVTKDGVVYLDDLTLNGGNSWTSDEQYISAGVITKAADGRYNVREKGHEYTVTEPSSFSYYWDLTADVYRPMVINGTMTMLIKTNDPTGTEGTDYYVIDEMTYQVSATTTPQLTARNDRRSNLNLKKLVTADTQAVDNVPNPDDVFTYTITVNDINGDAVWFSAQDESGATVSIDPYSSNVTPEIRDGNPTGSYSVPSGAEFTISIKAGWNVRFFNLPTGTTYSIRETGMVDGYEFVKAETSAKVTDPDYADDYQATPGTVSGDTVTGTIDQPNNVYSTEYTNNWNPDNEIVIVKTDENGIKLAGAQFKLSKKSNDGWSEIAIFTSVADAGETLKVGHGLYKLEETTAPTDYILTETVYFKVTTSGNTTTVALTDEAGVERTYPDVTASGNEVTIKNWPLTTAEATKAWVNADGTTTAPTGATVEFTLYANGDETEYTVTLNGAADETVPETAGGYESEGWTATFVNLPKYNTEGAELVEIVYTIAETTTYPGYTASTTDPVANGGTITNTQEATTANALKAWKNADGTTTAPEGATVVFTLYADGTATNYTVTLNGSPDTAPEVTGGYESEAWKASFVNLPKYQTGTTTEIVYTIAETTTYLGYTPDKTDPVGSGSTITNSQDPTSVDALKAWKNADGTTTAPQGGQVTYTLYADGEATEYTVTLVGTPGTAPEVTGGYESEAWKAEFVNLPKYQVGTTTEIVYTIGETTAYPGYTPDKTAPVASGETITNKQDVVEVNALKAWKNADGTTTAPEGATVVFTLLADGEATEYAVTLDGTAEETVPTGTAGYESTAWKALFINLPKYKADGTTEIKYTIKETTGYETYEMDPETAVESGETITNTQISTPIEIKKIGDWTPDKTLSGVQFELYSDAACTIQIKTDSTGALVGTDGIITTGSDGTATIGSFIPGIYYLKEVATADGYNLLEGSVNFTIKRDGTIEYSTGNTAFDSQYQPTYDLDEGGYGIWINNPSGNVLPHTGGSGTSKFYVLGSMLIAGSLMYEYSLRRNRKRKEVK